MPLKPWEWENEDDGVPFAPDLSKCPSCGGPADNGHDRELPPNVYACTKCSAKLADGAVFLNH